MSYTLFARSYALRSMDTVFVNDLKVLKVSDPELHEEFAYGYFVASKSKVPFSKMAFDQALEQNNKIIKSRAGLEDILN